MLYSRWMLMVCLAWLAGCSDGIATVDGRDISEQEFHAYLQSKRISPDNVEQRRRALDDYLHREALAAAALKTDLLDQAAIEVEVNEYRKQLVISRYFDEYLRDNVDDAAVASYYAANADKYRARKAHLAHILVRTRPEMSQQEREARLTTITEALSLINRGEDFADIAERYSEDTLSAGKGGDLGWMKEGAVAPAFSDAAFALSPGETSGIVTTPFGFHVIRLIEGPQVASQSLQSVEGDIRYQLRQRAKDEESQRLMSSVKVTRREAE
ncbi:peptidylprolyl isomerase [Alcanivorax sp. S71-1-4]|uniref:peptidylprolyl isomerase n=1 Tax=Alcanivorax sp. S71-1-4 TaxID=1177159 RepID=UPI00135BE461|nr:peptidylprolyl isomerase [Alcanivorax sp. S71-1-4]